MVRDKIFVCDNCGAEYAKWQGKCNACGAWNNLTEVKMSIMPEQSQRGITSQLEVKPQKISEISQYGLARVKSQILEFDRVLGGGLVPGSLVLLAGEPGIGKSTLLLQAISKINNVLYVSGEEAAQQIKMRFTRLKIKNHNLSILTDANIDNIVRIINKIKPRLVIVDSIQTMQDPALPSAPGNISQVKLTSLKLQNIAKAEDVPIILTSHVTKEGVVAGPMTLEHLVDAVIYLEGERYGPYRILRAVKNRFGKVSEVGLFEMTNDGLVEIKNPAAVFLRKGAEKVSGTAISCVLEGTRPILIEIQALAEKSIFGYPKRATHGVDLNRLFLQIAVLGKRYGLNLSNLDIYLNIVGGFKIKEPAIDLGCYTAIASAVKDKIVDPEMVIVGEVGLAGEIRPPTQLEQRVAEIAKLGFKKALVPEEKFNSPKSIKILKVRTLQQALDMALLK